MVSKKDLVILSHLRCNARQKLRDISMKTGIPTSTVHDRVKAYERRALKKHTTLIDFSKLGFNATANIAFTANRDSREALQDFLSRHRAVNTLYRTDHSFDFLGEFIFRDLSEAHDFVNSVEKSFGAQAQLMNVVEELKKEDFLTREEHCLI